MSFIHDHFLLNTATAKALYHDFAAPQPIIDYHCHLSPADLASFCPVCERVGGINTPRYVF
ncbi:glucuronate isomerase [Opitutales bacterium]|jgi:glucuronate isomerase|nr:glucuronate isomerase [Opitutales bacterium]MDB2506035.1 glucuronate isomerase [Opitutales bacterium]